MGTGKILNRKHSDTINAVVEGAKQRLKNPFYLFTDKQATIVTYYNTNIEKTKTDEDSKLMYSYTEQDSPLRFNKIENAYLFGINKMELDSQLEEFGLESSAVEGEAYVLPDTFQPYPQDYFIINHMDDKKIIFKVTSVSQDTFEDGANFWRIGYKLTATSADNYDLEGQVVDNFIMITTTIGTNMKSVIKKTDYLIIDNLEELLNEMKNYYQQLFFKNRLQTFIFDYNEEHFYDAYMIEFLKRNNILSGSDKYVYIELQVPLSGTFGIDYANTFFYTLEKRSLNRLRIPPAYATVIKDRSTLFYHRPDDYYQISYKYIASSAYTIHTVEEELLDMILNKKEYSKDNPLAYNNAMIPYLNNMEIDNDLIDIIRNMPFEPNVRMFYAIPEVIFVLEKYIESLLLK